MTAEERKHTAEALMSELLGQGFKLWVSSPERVLLYRGGVLDGSERAGCYMEIWPSARLTPEQRAALQEYRAEILQCVHDLPDLGEAAEIQVLLPGNPAALRN